MKAVPAPGPTTGRVKEITFPIVAVAAIERIEMRPPDSRKITRCVRANVMMEESSNAKVAATQPPSAWMVAERAFDRCVLRHRNRRQCDDCRRLRNEPKPGTTKSGLSPHLGSGTVEARSSNLVSQNGDPPIAREHV